MVVCKEDTPPVSLNSYCNNVLFRFYISYRLNMATTLLAAQIEEATAKISPEHRCMPIDGGIFSSIDSALLHLNNWAFLNGYGYVNTSGSTRERRWRYSCVFHSRVEGRTTQNTRRLQEEERVRVNTHARGISCPVGVTITQLVFFPVL